MATVNIMWFRRDLRLIDNAALYYALKQGRPVIPIFIFDKNILDELDDNRDRRVEFIHLALQKMQRALVSMQSSMEVYHDNPADVFAELLKKYTIGQVFANDDYEQYAIERDATVAALLQAHNITFSAFKDHVIFDKDEVLKDDKTPYTVFTPYSKKWKAALTDFYLASYPTEKYFDNFYQSPPHPMPTLEQLGFEKTGLAFPSGDVPAGLMEKYAQKRDYPAQPGTSQVGVHLRFGTVSIRQLATKARKYGEVYLNELIWREFYHMILWHFPHIGRGQAFKRDYDRIKWRYDEKEFALWCEGKTGYPLVDAGMRELNATGYMHNRVRMVTASFLTKHLLIDWRLGEAYFAKKLLDFDFAANNGGWQWAAGSGCDAAPYFRVFNPTLQAQKFDKDLKYIRKWIPELETFNYPPPMVKHEFARERVLAAYKAALKPDGLVP